MGGNKSEREREKKREGMERRREIGAERERERIRVGDRIANVITRRAFSPQLTERTGPEASGPRNDDTFHEGRSRKRVRRKLPVDGSSFIRRRTDQSNDSADCAETLLNTREYFICLPASPLLVTRKPPLPRCSDNSEPLPLAFTRERDLWIIRARCYDIRFSFWGVRSTSYYRKEGYSSRE